ncbi:hypothetical protein mRhiFer1_008342 [Rhinolophus ferrumequinum]|uniref:Uncharacterized protein n=1 Tax=Rhinolophus ferrumequinum TaxID=59479 RepID=A0A7J7VE00_RHIFE|nr:hypothetical protein mRhiFer1_008342 [Rhinolophus ferrumequinum]
MLVPLPIQGHQDSIQGRRFGGRDQGEEGVCGRIQKGTHMSGSHCSLAKALHGGQAPPCQPPRSHQRSHPNAKALAGSHTPKGSVPLSPAPLHPSGPYLVPPFPSQWDRPLLGSPTALPLYLSAGALTPPRWQPPVSCFCPPWETGNFLRTEVGGMPAGQVGGGVI